MVIQRSEPEPPADAITQRTFPLRGQELTRSSVSAHLSTGAANRGVITARQMPRPNRNTMAHGSGATAPR